MIRKDECMYEAISYVWGESTNKVRIECNGEPLNITRNLAAALTRFRLPDRARALWADALCINQGNVPEKESQVEMMGDIYRHAKTVLIWLGWENEPENATNAWRGIALLMEHAFPRLSEIAAWKEKELLTIEEINDMARQENRVQSKLRRSDLIISHFRIPRSDSVEVNSITSLLQRPWFHRAWTFQETFLARQRIFYCGSCEIRDEIMLKVIRSLFIISQATDDSRYFGLDVVMVAGMFEGKKFWARSGQYQTLKDQLILRRGALCERPEDRIYSLLGACDSTYGIRPDYSGKRPYQQLYADVAFRLMQNDSSLQLLAQAGFGLSTPNLPSWVPNWGERLRHRIISDTSKRVYSCSGSSKPQISLSDDFSELIMTGLQYGSITAIGRHSDLGEWKEDPYELTGEWKSTALARTMCADKKLFDSPSSQSRWDENSVDELNHLSITEKDGRYTAYLIATIQLNRKSRLFLLDNNALGIASETIEVEDIIVVPLGGEVPLVLRRTGERYLLVAECYVHGIMDGEALIEKRKHAQEDYDGVDKSWLLQLHDQVMPFPTQVFSII